MNHADQLLDDETIVAAGLRSAWASDIPRAAVAVGMVRRPRWCCACSILKHVRNWSYEVLEREVRANLVYRDFTRVGGGKMPDAKTMGRWGLAVGPEVIKQVHERMVKIAQDQGSCGRPADARGHHGGGDQHPLSDRLEPAGRRRARADARDEEDHHDRRRRSAPSCATAAGA